MNEEESSVLPSDEPSAFPSDEPSVLPSDEPTNGAGSSTGLAIGLRSNAAAVALLAEAD